MTARRTTNLVATQAKSERKSVAWMMTLLFGMLIGGMTSYYWGQVAHASETELSMLDLSMALPPITTTVGGDSFVNAQVTFVAKDAAALVRMRAMEAELQEALHSAILRTDTQTTVPTQIDDLKARLIADLDPRDTFLSGIYLQTYQVQNNPS